MCKKSKEKMIEYYRKTFFKMNEKKKKYFEKVISAGYDTVDDNIVPCSNLCILLSCPGEEEFLTQKVAAGQTGANLEKIINLLLRGKVDLKIAPKSNDESNCEIRYRCSIINASNHVYFRTVNSSEPTNDELEDENNTKRFKESLEKIEHIKYFLVCGENAKCLFDEIIAIDKKYIGCFYSLVPHIGNVGIRNAYPNSFEYDGKRIKDLEENERDNKRIKLIAERIENDFKERTISAKEN